MDDRFTKFDSLIKSLQNILSKTSDELSKSNYGPKKGGQYTPADNARRKMNNVGELDSAGTAGNVKQKQYTSAAQGTASTQATREANAAQAKSKKNPVKQYTKEELEAFAAERGAQVSDKVKKCGDMVAEKSKDHFKAEAQKMDSPGGPGGGPMSTPTPTYEAQKSNGRRKVKFLENGQWEMEKSVDITDHHRKLAGILNNYESEGNPSFNHHHIASTFPSHEAKKIVDTHNADPDHEKDHTVSTVSGAYHKAIGSEGNYKPSRSITKDDSIKAARMQNALSEYVKEQKANPTPPMKTKVTPEQRRAGAEANKQRMADANKRIKATAAIGSKASKLTMSED